MFSTAMRLLTSLLILCATPGYCGGQSTGKTGQDPSRSLSPTHLFAPQPPHYQTCTAEARRCPSTAVLSASSRVVTNWGPTLQQSERQSLSHPCPS